MRLLHSRGFRKRMSSFQTGALIDATFRALAVAERRILLEYLIEEHPAGVPVGSAIEHVASATSEEHKQVAMQMFHHHIPVLEEPNLVSYEYEDELLVFTGDELVVDVLDLL